MVWRNVQNRSMTYNNVINVCCVMGNAFNYTVGSKTTYGTLILMCVLYVIFFYKHCYFSFILFSTHLKCLIEFFVPSNRETKHIALLRCLVRFSFNSWYIWLLTLRCEFVVLSAAHDHDAPIASGVCTQCTFSACVFFNCVVILSIGGDFNLCSYPVGYYCWFWVLSISS